MVGGMLNELSISFTGGLEYFPESNPVPNFALHTKQFRLLSCIPTIEIINY